MSIHEPFWVMDGEFATIAPSPSHTHCDQNSEAVPTRVTTFCRGSGTVVSTHNEGMSVSDHAVRQSTEPGGHLYQCGQETDRFFKDVLFEAMETHQYGSLAALRFLYRSVLDAWAGNRIRQPNDGTFNIQIDVEYLHEFNDDNGIHDLCSGHELVIDFGYVDGDPDSFQYYRVADLLTDEGVALFKNAFHTRGNRFVVPTELGGGAPRREKYRRNGELSTRDAVRRESFTPRAAGLADELWNIIGNGTFRDPKYVTSDLFGVSGLPSWLVDQVTRTAPGSLSRSGLMADTAAWGNWGYCQSPTPWPELIEQHPDVLVPDHLGLVVNEAPSWAACSKAFSALRTRLIDQDDDSNGQDGEPEPSVVMEVRLWVTPDGKFAVQPTALNAHGDLSESLVTHIDDILLSGGGGMQTVSFGRLFTRLIRSRGIAG